MTKIVRTKPHPRFGATDDQVARNQEIRSYQNRIHQLEQHLGIIARTPAQISELERDITALRARCDALMDALRIVAAGKVTP